MKPILSTIIIAKFPMIDTTTSRQCRQLCFREALKFTHKQVNEKQLHFDSFWGTKPTNQPIYIYIINYIYL